MAILFEEFLGGHLSIHINFILSTNKNIFKKREKDLQEREEAA